MNKGVKNLKLLWHLTDIRNLSSILKYGLVSREVIYSNKMTLLKSDIADQKIIEKRRSLNLLNYVPFHFFVNNPFDGKILRDNPSKDFCYISIRRQFAIDNEFSILTKHPLAQDAKLLPYKEGFNEIDWDLLELRNYNNKECKLTCMAEVLSPISIKWQNYFSIVVRNQDDYSIVSNIINKELGFVGKKYFPEIKSNYFSARR